MEAVEAGWEWSFWGGTTTKMMMLTAEIVVVTRMDMKATGMMRMRNR